MNIQNCKRNIMGTVSFDGKTATMSKSQDFIVYPMQDSGTEIRIQSAHRFGRLDLATGKGVLSAQRKQYANAMWLSWCEAYNAVELIELSAEDLQTLRGWIKAMGGVLVGESFVKNENIGALAL